MQLKVLQWNVWFKQNIERVVDVLKTQDADIVCLQELTRGYVEQTRENTWEYIAHELGYSYRVQEVPIITEDAQWSQANAIFSRFPIVDRTATWIHEPDDPDDIHDQYRGYLATCIEAHDIRITVATTHMSFTERAGEDAEVTRLLSLVPAKLENFILTGDLNALPDSTRIAAITQRLQHAGPPYDVKTWTTKPFKHDNFEATTLDWRYDYIFTSPDVRVLDARTVKTDVSDHLPVLATVQLMQQ